uniref:Retrovirus-related Pol polyprotein from transposon TNT 1-94 n=1 Tax=Tanacetum cinerariifolium TaxID=118510 RepID=A0A6L2NMP4_TANCI|nr:retrovirus-related Pol polyprotein from transposon TNT 1-94 [Tanacetum cinerariifolium]
MSYETLIKEPLDESWIIAMQEELNQFIANDVWERCRFSNKLDKNGFVSRNKARLVAQGYNQQEGIDYDETYAPVARLDSIRILLAYACALEFKLFQMDVKSAFINGLVNEEGTDIETIVYAESDHAGDYVDRKSTSGICMFVECCLTSWFSKKQTPLAISTTEAEYGACVFTDKWLLDDLADGVPRDGPYQTNPTSPDDVILYIQNDREGQVTRIHHKQEIDVHDHQILTREIVSTMKPLEEIIWENVFCLGGDRDHLVMGKSPELFNKSYVLYDHIMNPLTAQQERKTRKDSGTRRGRHFTSSSSTFNQPSSSYLNDDDDDGNDEGEDVQEGINPATVAANDASKASELKRLYKALTVATLLKLGEEKKQRRLELEDSDAEASFVANSQSKGGNVACSSYIRKRVVLDDME